eukprot:SAG22_NODE_1647_length_3899_cov_39.380789_3_plen_87_part_00
MGRQGGGGQPNNGSGASIAVRAAPPMPRLAQPALYYSQRALWLATTVLNCTPLGVLTIQKLGDSQDLDLRLPDKQSVRLNVYISVT